jgi:hypothetical protein
MFTNVNWVGTQGTVGKSAPVPPAGVALGDAPQPGPQLPVRVGLGGV